MRDVIRAAETWQQESVGFGRAVAVRVHGSAPFPAGAVLLVADDGRLAGSVSGGCVESAAAAEVIAARRTGSPRSGR
jgi:xanthine dehydrogenase accessory factor